MKRMVTWILVADGGRAFALSNAEEARRFLLVPSFDFYGPHLRDRDIGSDRPTRVFSSVGAHRSAVGEAGALAREEERRFVQGVVEKLAARHAEGAFERLIITAPPRVLGDVRQALGPSLAEAVAAEIAADFVNTPLPEIGPAIEARLAADKQ